MKFEFSEQIFEKVSNIKFHQNPTSGSRVVPCVQTDRQTDMTKLIVAFCNFVNAPKKVKYALKQGIKAQIGSRGIDLLFL